MNSSKDDCRRRSASARRLLLGCLLLLLPVSPARADSWQQRASVPGPRAAHSAVWTGQEMIVWGGGVDGSFLNTGARYLPSTDTWRETSLYGAPSPRWFHAAVWTGSEMIIWGGRASFSPETHTSDGARYNPATDTWTSISGYGAPISRSQCAAVWTGEEMLVWGGETDGGTPLADGAAYNPATDTWRPISAGSGLAPRMEPTAVWTGSEMILFGGVDATQSGWLSYGDGARYNPFTDSWTPLPTTGAPGSRTGHTAVWTGERMIVWGGRDLPSDSRLNDGAIYTPASDSWTGISPYDAPQARMLHAAVWTGTEMIVWGGDAGALLNTGARYNPATGAWVPTTQANAPGKRMFWRPDLGIWTGRGMLVCAGSDYPASLDSTYLYSLFDPPCPPVIREQPQSLSVAVGSPVTLAVGAEDCEAGAHPTAEQEATGAQAARFEFDTGGREGRLKIAYQFFSVPDSLRVYYEGQRIFDEALSGEETIWVPFGPGQSTHVEIVINEDSGAPNTAWHYTVSFSPPLLRYQWRKNGTALEGETNPTLHFPSVSLEDAGDYSVTIANNSSSVVSDAATLTVLPPSSTNCVAVPSGVVAWWRAEGNAEDAVGTNEGTLLYGATFAPGRIGQAFSFDGTGSRVSIPDTGAFRLTESLSFEGWIQAASWAPGIIFFRGDNRGGLDPYHMSLSPSGHLHWGIVAADNQWAAVDAPETLPLGVWTHVAGVLDGTTGELTLYVNGVRVSHTTTSLRPFADLDPNSEPVLGIGNHGGTFHNFPFHGLIDEWALYSRALSAAEIQAIFLAGGGKCDNPPSPAGVHDLARDYSTSMNPNGAWSFGWKSTLAGDFNLFGYHAFELDNGALIDYWLKDSSGPSSVYHNSGPDTLVNNDGQGVYPPGTVWFGPGYQGNPDNFSVIRFTVPNGAGGTYRVYSMVRSALDGPISGDTDFHVLKNGSEVFGENLPPNTGTSYLNHLALAEGDTIEFACGRGQDGNEYASGLKIQATLTLVTNVPPPACAPLGLVAWWRADGNALDVTGAHDGELLFGTTFSPGVSGQAFTFDLSLARVSIPDEDAFKLTDSLSFEGWINVASHAPGIIFIRGDNRGGLDPYHMSIQPSGQLHWGINTAENDFTGLYSPGAVSTGVWMHVAAVLDGATGNMGLYIDGSLVNQTNTNLRPLRDLDPNWEPAVGIGNAGGTFHHFPYHGSVDEWALYSRALSAVEIQSIFNAGAAGKCVTKAPPTNCVAAPPGLAAWWSFDGNLTDSVNQSELLLQGAPTMVAGKVGQALRFDGVDDGARAPASAALNVGTNEGFSIELWVKPQSVTLQPLVVWSRLGNFEGAHFWLGVYGAGSIYANVVDVNGGQHSWRSDTDIVVTNEWQHVGMSYDKVAGLLRFYLNGQKVTEHVLGTFTPLTGSAVELGHHTEGNEHFAGAMDELSIYRRVLNDAEMQSIYNAGAAGKCLGTNPPQPVVVFDVSRDFSATSNPTGPWSYGYAATLGGPFHLLTFAKSFAANNGVPISAWQVSDVLGPTVNRVMGNGVAMSEGGAFTAPSGTVYVWPGNEGAPGLFGVIRFTAPAGGGGIYRIDSAVRPTFDGPVSGDTDFHVLKNGQELFGQFLASNTGTGYSNIVTLASGDSIDFVVGRGADGSPDHSSLKVHAVISLVTNLPPPPTNQVFDLSTDFSPTSNPAGPWSYGYLASLDGSFNLLTFAKNFASENGVPLFSWQVADNSAPGVARVMGNRTAVSEGGAFTAAPGTVWIAPGYDGSPDPFGVVRFTVPAGRGGHYRLETSVRSNFDGPVSGDSEFHVLDNRQEVFGRFLPPNSATGYTNMLTLEEGDTIDFIVGRGADGLESHSSLRIQAMLTLVTNTPPPPARVFDLSGDFSLAANPNGAWSYGHRTNRLTGGIQLLNTSRTFGAENGVPIDIWQLNNAKPWVAKVIGPATAVSFHFNAPAGTIYFGPDPDATPEDFAVIRFTVPPGAGGGYRLETSVRSLYDNTRSADADFHLVKNGQELFGAVVPPNSATGYSNIVTLAVGDRIDFVAGRGPNALPETGLKIHATLTSETGMAMSIGSTLPLADGGGVRVTGTAPPGSVCRVQRSVNLIDWEDAGSVTATASGVFEFIDSQPADGPACFYRLRGFDH